MTAPLDQSLSLATDRRGIDQAARLIGFGQLVGASFGSVFGIVGDGQRVETAAAVAAVKGQRRIGKPLSVCLPGEDFAKLIDPAQVAPRLRTWAKDGRSLAHTLSSLCFLRAPIRQRVAATFPAHLISFVNGVPYMQNVDPNGIPAVRGLMHRLHNRGVTPAVTSMNLSGQPTITETVDAERFITTQHVPGLLNSERLHMRARGSFSILEIGPAGIRAVRHGVIPVDALRTLIDEPIDDVATAPPDYPPVDVPAELLTGLSHRAACRALLLWIGGANSVPAIRAWSRLPGVARLP